MKCRAGFSLIEMLIAVALIAISILPLLQLYSGGMEQIHLTGIRVTALSLLQEGVEKIRNGSFTEAQLEARGDFWDPPEGDPPREINHARWRVFTAVDKGSDPLKMTVRVFHEAKKRRAGQEYRAKIMEASILFEDLDNPEAGTHMA